MMAHRYNRLTATGAAGRIPHSHAGEPAARLPEGPVIFASGDLGVGHILSSQGIPMVGLGANAARNAARGGIRQVIPAAEAAGCLPEQCSYGKIAIGGCALVSDGRSDEISSDCRMPKADFVVFQTACPVQMYIAHNIQDIYHVPCFELDIPSFYELCWLGEGRVGGDEWERNHSYVVSQLREFIVFLEDITGRAYDWNALKQVLVSVKEASTVRNQLLRRYGRAAPSPLSFFDMIVAMGMTFGTQKASGDATTFWERVTLEVAARVEKGIGSVEHERFRLFWHEIPVLFSIGGLARLFARCDASVVAGDYALVDFYPDGIDPDRPLESLARAMLLERVYTHPEEFETARLIEQMALFAPIHGVLLHVPRTCRSESVRMLHRAEILGEKLNIPVLTLDMDMCDPQFYVEAGIETRVEAFIEALEGRKPWWPQ